MMLCNPKKPLGYGCNKQCSVLSKAGIGLKPMLGSSLISLMVGMLVSMIAILACMSLYKTLINVSVEAKVDALHDGQLAATLLAMQLRIQNAGFGLNNTGTHILTTEVAEHKTLMWRYSVDGVVNCEGIRRREFTDNNQQKIAIDSITVSDTSCNEMNVLADINWEHMNTLAVFNTEITESVDFNIHSASCFPYGMGEANDHYMLTLTGRTSAKLYGAKIEGNDIPDTTLSLCLNNIRST